MQLYTVNTDYSAEFKRHARKMYFCSLAVTKKHLNGAALPLLCPHSGQVYFDNASNCNTTGTERKTAC